MAKKSYAKVDQLKEGKDQAEEDGKVPDYVITWSQTGIDWIFMITTVTICF